MNMNQVSLLYDVKILFKYVKREYVMLIKNYD